MRAIRWLIGLIAGVGLAMNALGDDKSATQVVAEQVLEVSYLVETETALGSCTVFGKDGRTFAWTAAHVVAGLYGKESRYVDGEIKEVPYFRPCYVVKQLTEDGRIVGFKKYEARVIAVDFARDIALLRVLHHLTDRPIHMLDHAPEVGTSLVHGGSRWGYVGIRSVTFGSLAQIGTFLSDFPEMSYDLVTSPASPGSSGGGVFVAETGEYAGMVVRGAESTFILIVPARDIFHWGIEHGFEWAVMDSVKAPSDDELKDIFPVIGISGPPLYSLEDAESPWKYLIMNPSEVPELKHQSHRAELTSTHTVYRTTQTPDADGVLLIMILGSSVMVAGCVLMGYLALRAVK